MALIDTYNAANPSIITNGLQVYYSFDNPNCWMKDTRFVYGLEGVTTGSLRANASMSYDIDISYLSSSGAIIQGRGINITASADIMAYSSGSTYCFWANYAPNATSVNSVVSIVGCTISKATFSLLTGSGGHTGVQMANSYFGINAIADADTNGWHF